MNDIKVSIFVAFARNMIIGSEGGMPWTLQGDLKRFKQMTMGKPIVMGRKTFESIGRPLPGRTNIIVSKQLNVSSIPGVVVLDTFAGAVDAAKNISKINGLAEVCVIGGGQIYREAISIADYIYATEVQADITGDTSFPEIDLSVWKAFMNLPGPEVDAHNSHPTRYVSYKRI